MIVDVTDPKNPVEKAHIPSPAGGQAQMARMCLGSTLPGGQAGHVYLLRNVQGGASAGYEMWDVSNPGVAAPQLVMAQRNLRSTHKHWWECSTGISYMPGSRNANLTAAVWATDQAMVIYDWSLPGTAHAACGANLIASDGATVSCPKYLRTYGLVGGQPGGPGTTSLHGAISAFEHPQATSKLTLTDDVIGNRIYAAWGVGDDGVLQILDRDKLLPVPYGSYAGSLETPTNAEIEFSQAGIMYMSPDQGGHTSFPVFGVKPKSYQCFKEFTTRDIVLLASEATANRCNEAPHWSFIVDVTVENSKAAPPNGNIWQGPMVLSTMWVDPRAGEKYKRGNYCTRGARFGVHSSEENFRNPYYGRVTFLAYFTGGVRAFDIREPQGPVEIAFYVPEANANTAASGYMTNNVEVDDRGYIYIVDRGASGMDIIELQGPAKQIALGQANRETGDCVNNIPAGGGGGGGG
jgi:hypothetical protein